MLLEGSTSARSCRRAAARSAQPFIVTRSERQRRARARRPAGDDAAAGARRGRRATTSGSCCGAGCTSASWSTSTRPSSGAATSSCATCSAPTRQSGALAVGDQVAVGQTVQFHVRDAGAADEDLRELLAGVAARAPRSLFTCNGRGRHLFGVPDHDAGLVDAAPRPDPARGRVLRRRDRPGRRSQLPPRLHRQPRPLPREATSAPPRRRTRERPRPERPVPKAARAGGTSASVANRRRDRHVGGKHEGAPRGGRLRAGNPEDPPVPSEIEQRGINVIRGLAMDAVQKANSGHPGTPMALAPLAHVLFTRVMRYDAQRTRLARPRPVRALERARVDAPLLDALPHRLRARARRPRAVPAVGLDDAGSPRVRPRAGHRGHDRSARPGHRQRGRHRARRGATCARASAPRSPTTTSSRSARRRPRGGREPRGRVARRSPRSRSARRRLRRQPHHDRRPDRARVHRRRPEALRGVRLARRRARRGRQRPRRARGGAPRGHGRGGPAERSSCCAATSAGRRRSTPTRRRRTATPLGDGRGPRGQGDPRPAARRALLRARRRARATTARPARAARREREAWEQRTAGAARPRARRCADDYDACLDGRGLDGWEAKLPTWTPGERSRRASACSARCSTRSSTSCPASSAAAPTSPGNTGTLSSKGAGDHRTHELERAPDPLRHPRARHGRDHERHGGRRARSRSAARSSCSATTCARRCASPRSPATRSRSSGRTTRSVSARTARPTSRSSSSRRCGRCPGLRVIRPADANETAEAWRVHIDGDGPTAIVLTRQKVPVLEGTAERARRRCRAGRVRARRRARPATSTSCSSAPAPRCRSASARRELLAADGSRRPGRVDAVLGAVRGARPDEHRDEVLPPGVPDARGRGRRQLRLGALRRRRRRDRPLRRVGARATSRMREFGFTAEHVVDRARALLGVPDPRHCDATEETRADAERRSPG